MSTPEATIILPTLDRAATLPVALGSAQRQTVTDIEILVVLDGATQACRDIAVQAADADPRIRVLDLPKAPGSGAANVQHALGLARSEHIFYTDDDDILLPQHVATLGAELRGADIADSRVATASREFDLHLVPCPTAAPLMRRLLADYRHKSIYDTHIAHTRTAYHKFTRWTPETGPSDRPVWYFLQGFAAAPDCRWTACKAVTALSLHRANRRDMSPDDRRAEILRWDRATRDPTAWTALLSGATSHCHLSWLLNADSPDPSEPFDAYLTRHGAFDDVAPDPTCRDVYAFFVRTLLPLARTREVIRRLSTQSLVGCLAARAANFLHQTYGSQTSTAILMSLLGREGPHLGGANATLAHLRLRDGDRAGAIVAMNVAASIGPDPNRQFATALRGIAAAH